MTHSDPESTSPDVPGLNASGRIAIVDDEPGIRAGLRRLCVAFGFEVTTHESGREFIAALETGTIVPDCLLLDTQMPDMNGVEVQRRLTAGRHRLPIVVLTADDSAEARERGLALGAFDYLAKPITAQDLVETVSRAIASSRNGRSTAIDVTPPSMPGPARGTKG